MQDSTKEAYRHLKKDPVMHAVIQATGLLEKPTQYAVYPALLSSVLSQQLSSKAAETIKKRLQSRFDHKFPEPEVLLPFPQEELRACGLSNAKAVYLKGIAEFALKGQLNDRELNRMSDQEVVAHLVQLKGVGRWTAEMILIFSLGRPDVFPVDDAGIRQALQTLYGFNTERISDTWAFYEISRPWAPYRSLAARHLWRWLDGG